MHESGQASSDGGFTGKSAELYQNAYAQCFSIAKRSAAANPPSSVPGMYPLSNSYPKPAVGAVKPQSPAELTALKRGCAAAEVAAFSAAHSPSTSLICHTQSKWLPKDLSACKQG
jgi:hypothetical protein